MSLIIVAALTIGAFVAVALVALAVPTVAGLLAYDVSESRHVGTTVENDPEERIWLERGFARGFVIAGGLFWTLAMLAGILTTGGGASYAWVAAFFPLVVTLATLAVGWYFERSAAVLLVIGSAAVVAWGVVAGFELGVWTIMLFALIGPMLTAAGLFWMARNDQHVFDVSVAARASAVPIAPIEDPRF